MSTVPTHEENRSGWFGNLHIYAPPVIKTPKWTTHERLADCAAVSEKFFKADTGVRRDLVIG